MARAKKTNQRTRQDIKRADAQNADCSTVKPRPDRLPKSDGVGLIAEVVSSNGSKRIDCVIVNTTYLDIDLVKKMWQLPDLTVDTKLLPKLKKLTRYRTVKVMVGNLVFISYGDRLDFCYTTEESKWLRDNAIVKSDGRGDVSFAMDESTNDDISFTQSSEVVESDGDESDEADEAGDINLDDI